MNPETRFHRDEVLDVIRRSVAVVVPEIDPAAVTPDRSLADLGCNSIDRADIVTLAMEELGISAPLRDLQRGGDVGGLIKVLQRHA